jgi:hypothetical protein
MPEITFIVDDLRGEILVEDNLDLSQAAIEHLREHLGESFVRHRAGKFKRPHRGLLSQLFNGRTGQAQLGFISILSSEM